MATNLGKELLKQQPPCQNTKPQITKLTSSEPTNKGLAKPEATVADETMTKHVTTKEATQ